MHKMKIKKLPSEISNLLYKLYQFRRLRKPLERICRKYDGGEYWSNTLRRIYADYHGVRIGIGSYGCFDSTAFPSGTTVGNYCSIAGGVRYFNTNHPSSFASLHPMFYNPRLGFVKESAVERYNLTIEPDVWIGYNVLIVCKCRKIGMGSIIGAGSVVTHDVEPFTIVAGVPAKVIGRRFDQDVADQIRASAWYELPPEKLAEKIGLVRSVQSFADEIECMQND